MSRVLKNCRLLVNPNLSIQKASLGVEGVKCPDPPSLKGFGAAGRAGRLQRGV